MDRARRIHHRHYVVGRRMIVPMRRFISNVNIACAASLDSLPRQPENLRDAASMDSLMHVAPANYDDLRRWRFNAPIPVPRPTVNVGTDAEPITMHAGTCTEPLANILEQQEHKLLINKHTLPNRFKYAGIKLNRQHLNPEPDMPTYVKSEQLKHKEKRMTNTLGTHHPSPSIVRPLNYMWFFTKHKVPKYAALGDADLTNFLRLHCFCQPRTMPLVHSLKLKAIQFMSDFDTTGITMGELYRIISSSIAAALIPSKDEEMLLETVKSCSNLMEDMQPFFSDGQYRKPTWFCDGKTLNPRK
ncbi:MAG: hypothetical protein GuTV1_gp1 [Guiyang tombus-like virus 1]|nr:MAG: hypothetical protein GuTV1_gp1 [Guiyang tombus-like virus 1]